MHSSNEEAVLSSGAIQVGAKHPFLRGAGPLPCSLDQGPNFRRPPGKAGGLETWHIGGSSASAGAFWTPFWYRILHWNHSFQPHSPCKGDERAFRSLVTCAASTGFRMGQGGGRHHFWFPEGNWKWFFIIFNILRLEEALQGKKSHVPLFFFFCLWAILKPGEATWIIAPKKVSVNKTNM